MSLRIDEEDWAALSVLSEVYETPISGLVRDAITAQIAWLREHPEFSERLARATERNEQALDILRRC